MVVDLFRSPDVGICHTGRCEMCHQKNPQPTRSRHRLLARSTCCTYIRGGNERTGHSVHVRDHGLRGDLFLLIVQTTTTTTTPTAVGHTPSYHPHEKLGKPPKEDTTALYIHGCSNFVSTVVLKGHNTNKNSPASHDRRPITT